MKSLYDTLQESLVTEMSIGLKDFKYLVDDVAEQIIENWCLVWYCDTYDRNNINRNHWASKFLAQAKRIASKNINKRNKNKAIKDVLTNWNTYRNKFTIINCISEKIKKEHLDKYIDDMAYAFTKNISDLIDILSSDFDTIQDYMKYPIGY